MILFILSLFYICEIAVGQHGDKNKDKNKNTFVLLFCCSAHLEVRNHSYRRIITGEYIYSIHYDLYSKLASGKFVLVPY